MKSLQSFGDLILISFVALLALVFATFPVLSVPVVHPIIGAILVLFVPGYAFVAALYPQKTALTNGVRLGLSLGVSLAIVPLLEIILNYTSYGIRLGPTVVIMTLFTLGCSAVASARRQRLPPDQRYTVYWQALRKSGEQQKAQTSTSLDQMLSVVLVLAIIASASVAVYAIVTPNQGEHFSEFYLLGANGTLGNYTTQYKVGTSYPVTIDIVNHEGQDVTYNLTVLLNDSSRNDVIYSEQVAIANDQQWEKQIPTVINRAGDNMRLDFLLCADDFEPCPYREAHLWVNATN